jgi:hypothetical protein
MGAQPVTTTVHRPRTVTACITGNLDDLRATGG